jgi:hypothetical protein
MADPIDEYRNARDIYRKLQGEAKKALLARHQELSAELLQIQRELREEFGVRISFPGKAKAAPAKKKAPPKAAAEAPVPPVKSSPKINGLQKSLTVQRQKLEEAQKAGKDPKAIKDRIFELEDALRLATT